MTLSKEVIAEMAAGCGLDLIGATETGTPSQLRQRLEQRHRESRTTAFEEIDIDRRIDPKKIWPDTRSILVIGTSYLLPAEKQVAPPPEPLGKVARCAQGLDYHRILKIKAEQLVSKLRKMLPVPLNYQILVDRNPLVERELATQAGLGLIGENCHLISPSKGSYMALGTILVDRRLEPSLPPDSTDCRKCGRCREACPTGALIAPYIIDPARCLSYISQLPGVIPEPFRPLMGNLLYGCDRCQEVCPYNQGAMAAVPAEESFPFFPAEPRLIPLLSMTRREFSTTIALSAAGWRGKTTLQRNAVIALGNSKHPGAVESLVRVLVQDPRPVIRLHAAWSLGSIGGARARYYLEKCRYLDPQRSVREEAGAVLERIG